MTTNVLTDPISVTHNPDLSLTANGQPVTVHRTSAGPFAGFVCNQPTQLVITSPTPIRSVHISPARFGLQAQVAGSTLEITLPGPMHLAVEINHAFFFVFADAPDPNPPSPTDPNVIYFKAGQVHTPGDLELRSGQTLYLEPGAIVNTHLYAVDADNLRIAGAGIIDCGGAVKGHPWRIGIELDHCRDVSIDGPTLIEATGWMLVIGACEQVRVRNLKLLSARGGQDGIDIVGSHHVHIENCFVRTGDDCVVFKAQDRRGVVARPRYDWSLNVHDVVVEGCQLMSYLGGCATEIGHETCADQIHDIVFRDLDIICVHQYGAPFGVHIADRAEVSRVLYENIRVEHHYDKLLDLRVVRSRWSTDAKRGCIRDVTFRNIDVTVSLYNPGYTCSLIGGFDADHRVTNVRFENFRLNGSVANSADELDLYLRHADDVVFTEAEGGTASSD